MKAFVLNKWPYSESDWIVEFYVESEKVLQAFAVSARRSRRRFPHQFHAAGLYELEVSDTRIKRCDLLHFYENLPKDLEIWSRWLCILEWLRRDQANSSHFEEISKLAESFDRAEDSAERDFYVFFIIQLERHGLLSEMKKCLRCLKEFQASDELVFAFGEGGLCHRHCREGVAFSAEAAFFVQKVLEEGASTLNSRDWLPETFEVLEQTLVPFLEFQLGQKLKSFHFLQKIRHQSENLKEKGWQNQSSPMF